MLPAHVQAALLDLDVLIRLASPVSFITRRRVLFSSTQSIPRPVRNRLLIGLAAAVTVGTVCALVITVTGMDLDRPSWSKPQPEPIPDQTASTLEISGVIPEDRIDWATTRMRNTTNVPATITGIELIPGGPSKNLMPDPEFYALGIDRSFGDGVSDAPSDAS